MSNWERFKAAVIEATGKRVADVVLADPDTVPGIQADATQIVADRMAAKLSEDTADEALPEAEAEAETE